MNSQIIVNKDNWSGEHGSIIRNGDQFVVSDNDNVYKLVFGNDEAGDYADLFIVRGRFPERIDRGRLFDAEWIFDRRSDQCPFIAAAKHIWLSF